MAKVVIEIEDKENGRVSIVAKPNFLEMMMKENSGHGLTSAEAYAVFMLNQVRKEAKSNEPTAILIPRLGK